MFPLEMMAFRFTEIITGQMNEWRVKWEDEVILALCCWPAISFCGTVG